MRGYNVQECGGEQYTLTATVQLTLHLRPVPPLFVAMSEFTPAPRLTLHAFFSLSDVEGGVISTIQMGTAEALLLVSTERWIKNSPLKSMIKRWR